MLIDMHTQWESCVIVDELDGLGFLVLCVEF